jgi:SagB-type dehydrogenase family enzyme
MTWTNLGDPKPHKKLRPYTPFAWPKGESRALSEPQLSKQSFVDVLYARRSERTFDELDSDDLSKLLLLSYRAVSRITSDLGFELSMRPVPSAGAIHPIHLLIASASSNKWHRYAPFDHSLMEVPQGMLSVTEAVNAISLAIHPQKGTIIWLAAEIGKTSSKYEHAESLIWRDAGVLIAQLGLVSSYLGLNFCPLGMTGGSWAQALNQDQLICGVGVAIVGSPPRR